MFGGGYRRWRIPRGGDRGRFGMMQVLYHVPGWLRIILIGVGIDERSGRAMDILISFHGLPRLLLGKSRRSVMAMNNEHGQENVQNGHHGGHAKKYTGFHVSECGGKLVLSQ
jgi:hypothetical protein